MHTLYTKNELSEIEKEIIENKGYKQITMLLSFETKLIFTQKKDYYIQRLDNKTLGLVYSLKTNEFIYNYPHLGNAESISALSNDSVIETKKNGTNLGFIKLSDGTVVYRTRGAIEAEMIPNEINSAIAINRNSITGVNTEVFKMFSSKYETIFKEGKEKGFIDDFGSVRISKFGNELKEKLKSTMMLNKEIVGIFGELVSKYNPICVDGELKYGISHVFENSDYNYFVFDILVKDENGNINFIDYDNIKKYIKEDGIIKIVSADKLSNLEKFFQENELEEGVVIKDAYLKYKRSQVLSWERLVGNLGNILAYSVSHVFSESGISSDEVMNGLLLDKEQTNNYVASVFQEVATNGVTKEDLSTFYKGDDVVNSTVYGMVQSKLMVLVASILKEKGIDKSKLYLEIPKYLYFEFTPLLWNERRQKFLPTASYSKKISSTIGHVF